MRKVNINIRASHIRFPRRTRRNQRPQVSLPKWPCARNEWRSGFNSRCASVSQNRRINTTSEAKIAPIRIRADPVVPDGLVGRHDGGITLPSEDLEGVDDEGGCFFAVGFDDFEDVLVDGEREGRVAGHSDDPEAVAFAFGDVDDGEVDGFAGGIEVPAFAVDERGVGVGGRNDSGLFGCGFVKPVGQGYNRRFIIYIVVIDIWLIVTLNDERAPQTVAILSRQMRVIPVRARLPNDRKVIKETTVRGDGALRNKCRSVGPVPDTLEDAVPMNAGRQ